MKAEITLEYDDAKVAEAIANAVSPDNFKTPTGLLVKTTWQNTKVQTNIECERQLPTLIATIDDLLSCVSTAEKSVRATQELE